MVGNNEVKINKATMIEALTLYFKEKVFKDGQSFVISDLTKDSQYGGETYSVILKCPESASAAT